MLNSIRRSFRLKLFISYFAVILVGAIVLFSAANFVIPAAFNRHMGAMMGTDMGMMGASMSGDLFTNFRAAAGEALGWAAGASFLAAVVMSAFVSRQVVAPIRAMTLASRHIADGHYDKRVPAQGRPGEGDEMAELAASFNRMAEKLAQTEEMRSKLIGDVAHELRTPLTTIMGSMEGLLDGVLPASEETFQSVHREADRLQRLVSDLQELSRAEGGSMPLQTGDMELTAWISTVVDRLKPQFEQKHVRLELDLPGAPVRFTADADRLTQVLINLLGNALQYTSPGGRVNLGAAVERAGNSNGRRDLRLVVQDTGVGIPADHLPHIFDRFYRVDKSRSRAGGGSGIGLTIARHWVAAHGGTIRAESGGPGEGSTFTIHLPLVD